MNKRACWMLGLLVAALWPAAAQEIAVQKSIDWEKRFISFRLSAPVDQRSLPVSKQAAEGLVDRLRVSEIAESLSEIALDAQGPFASAAAQRPDLTWSLEAAAAMARKDYSIFSSDMKRIDVAYVLSFSDIYSHIAAPQAPALEPNLMATGVFDYSGIVIYAAEALPVRNLQEKALLRPALSPSIFSASGETVLNAGLADSQSFKRWGVAGYTYAQRAAGWPADRVGLNPLVIAADAVYGDYKSDVIISDSDAARILASDQGRQMLASGRILLIIAPPLELESAS